VENTFHTAVADASFDVKARERIIVIGPSGCGKSTLLKAVAGCRRTRVACRPGGNSSSGSATRR
jgi:ABC-type Fe3+/spermidine/putrescine transport system ATPase subunit